MHTPGERSSFPSLEVLGDLWHFDVRIKLFYFIEDSVLVIVTKVVVRLLLRLKRG